MKRKIRNIVVLLLLLAGCGALLYPIASNWLVEKNQTRAIEEYDLTVKEWSDRRREEERKLAREYNALLNGSEIVDPFIPESGYVLPQNYLSILDIGGTIGSIEIPKIHVSLPIYHGTSQEVLQEGVGHLEATAFPVGGEGNHTVLTGHRGLPSAKLFTDLDKLEIGDVFYIHVLDEVLAYKVDQIKVVEPSDTNDLRPVKEKDYVTLLTCTPYGVNSHRLLVRAERTPYIAGEEEAAYTAQNKMPQRIIIGAVLLGLVILIAGFILYRKKRSRRKKRKAG